MENLKRLVFSAFFMALGLVMPFLTGQIPEIGNMLLPMHLPVLLSGFICGWKYGMTVGFIVPLLRSVIFGMPPILSAIGMAFELATYGTVTGILHEKLPKSKWAVYVSLLLAMMTGRVVWGVVSVILYGLSGTAFSWQMFVGGALLNAIPGIILQIVFVPVLVMASKKQE